MKKTALGGLALLLVACSSEKQIEGVVTRIEPRENYLDVTINEQEFCFERRLLYQIGLEKSLEHKTPINIEYRQSGNCYEITRAQRVPEVIQAE